MMVLHQKATKNVSIVGYYGTKLFFFAENYEERFLIGLSDPSATLIVTVARNLEFQFERRLDSCFCNKQYFKFENVI